MLSNSLNRKDPDAAVKWYMDILGFQALKPMVHTFRIFDTNLQESGITWLGTGESVGGPGKGLRILWLYLSY